MTSLFDTIYGLAVHKNRPELKKLVDQGLCLDIVINNVSLLYLLAKNGEIGAVNILVNDFNCNRDHALWGFAAAGFHEQAATQLALGAEPRHALIGYAQAGFKPLKEIATDHAGTLIWWYAFGGFDDLVDELLVNATRLKEYALRGYALSGNITKVDEILEQTRLIRNGSSEYMYKIALEFYARAGHIKQVKNLLDEALNLFNPNLASSFYLAAAQGYAFSGNVNQVDALLERGLVIDYVAQYYAMGGHVTEVNKLIKQSANLNLVVNGYIQGGHLQQINALIALGANHFQTFNSLQRNGYLSEQGLRILVLIEDDKFRHYLAARMAGGDELINKAEYLRQIMVQYQLNYQQAITCNTKGGDSIRYWLLTGPQLVRNKILPADVFFNLSSFVCGMSLHHTTQLFDAIHNQLFCDMLDVNLHKYKHSFFAKSDFAELQASNQTAKDQYQMRTMLYPTV